MQNELPIHPNISQLKRQAKELKLAVRAGEPDAVARAGGPADISRFGLRDAQLIVARELGFDGWHALLEEVGERMIDERDLHRWFGVNLNNRIWQRMDAADIDAESAAKDRDDLLYGAYASAYHWRQVGTPVHHARGEHLIARVALRVGRPDTALLHALRCLELVEEHPDLAEDWDLAFAHEALARCHSALGDHSSGREHRETAAKLGAAITDDEDRAVFLAELERGEWFGLGSLPGDAPAGL